MEGKINRSKLNFTIDMVMFIGLMAIAGIGFLIKYVLIPGYKRNEIYGKDVELFYGGLDRHQWGSVHLIISFVFLFLLLLHIVFHWKQIVSLSRRLIPVKYTRYFMVFSLLIVSLLLGLAPLFVQPQIQESSSHHHNQDAVYCGDQYPVSPAMEVSTIGSKTKEEESMHRAGKNLQREKTDIEVYGYMTLQQVSIKYGLPVSDLASVIHVPMQSSGEKLGRLRKQYSFHLNDLRDYIRSNNRN